MLEEKQILYNPSTITLAAVDSNPETRPYLHHASDEGGVALCVLLREQVKYSLCIIVFFP